MLLAQPLEPHWMFIQIISMRNQEQWNPNSLKCPRKLGSSIYSITRERLEKAVPAKIPIVPLIHIPWSLTHSSTTIYQYGKGWSLLLSYQIMERRGSLRSNQTSQAAKHQKSSKQTWPHKLLAQRHDLRIALVLALAVRWDVCGKEEMAKECKRFVRWECRIIWMDP